MAAFPQVASTSLTPSASTHSIPGPAVAPMPGAVPAAASPVIPSSASKPAKKATGAAGIKTKPNTNPLAARADEVTYRTKYQQLKVKVKDIEDENAEILAKILTTKRQIQRLRLERSMLYERLTDSKGKGVANEPNLKALELMGDQYAQRHVQKATEELNVAVEPQISVSSPPKPEAVPSSPPHHPSSPSLGNSQLAEAMETIPEPDQGATAEPTHTGASVAAAGSDLAMLVDP